MKNRDRLAVLAVVLASVSWVACSSSSGGGGTAGDGGSSSGGSSGSGSGGGSSGAGACVLYTDDAGNPADSGTTLSCLVSTLNGSDITGSPCSSGLTYATACPTTGLQGCCTIVGSSAKGSTLLVDTCDYALPGVTMAEEEDAGVTPAQLQARCIAAVDGGGQGGTWSTTPL